MNTPWLARAAAGVLALSVITVMLVIGGAAGLGYAVLFTLAMAHGLPIGFALFGRRQAAGWIAGLLLGYAASAFAWWAVVYCGVPSTALFFAAWVAIGILMLACAFALGWRWTSDRALVALPPWTPACSAALALVLLLAPALIVGPFARLGSRDAAGNRLYRAYFIVDFVWHTALTAELAKEEQPPRNPYLASQPVHYYWTYFRVPATLSRHGHIDVETALKVSAFGAALLLLSSTYLAAWVAFPAWPLVVAAALALTVLAPGAEGLAAMADLIRRGRPLSELRDLNIDSVAAWAFKGLRIDDLPRAMWYTPQHSVSYALGLLSLPVALVAGVGAPPTAIALTGVALGASLSFNPLVGAFFCAVYGAVVVVDAVRRRAGIGFVLRHAIAVVPVLLAYGWCTLNQVGEGATDALHFGFWGPARNGTIMTFLLSFGPLLIPIVVALWPARGRSWGHLSAAIIGVVMSVLLMHLVTLTVDQAWVGFRGGHLFLVTAPALVAAGLIRLVKRGASRAAIATAAVVLIAGMPTTVIDAYNAQDVTNFDISPGDFHFTVSITPAEQQALEWIRTHTPPTAIVQAEPIVRGRETWSLIPSWAERRMAGGNALPLLAIPDYTDVSERVHQLYATGDARSAWQSAKGLNIAYLYVDATERRAYPAVAKFDQHPEYFAPAFSNSEVAVYAVRP